MKLPKYTQRGSLDFNMTPMIDVTFQLIIFFLVSSNMTQQQSQVSLELPPATQGRDEPDVPGRRITVNLTTDGRLIVAGEAVDEEVFNRRLAAERRTNDELELRIRCDRQVVYGRVKPILRAALDHDIWKVTFAVVKPETRR